MTLIFQKTRQAGHFIFPNCHCFANLYISILPVATQGKVAKKILRHHWVEQKKISLCQIITFRNTNCHVPGFLAKINDAFYIL
jgi:hypothetical protein